MIETETGSTARASLLVGRVAFAPRRNAAQRYSGGADGEAHRVTVLGVAHDLPPLGDVGAQHAAQLAYSPPAGKPVHALADQRRAPTVLTAVAILGQCAHAAAQQLAFEPVGVAQGEGHAV